jgi:predicted permease
MDALLIMLKNVIVFVLLALPGYILVKSKQLKPEQAGALSKVLMYVGMPFLILSSTLKLSFNPGLIKTLLIVAVIGILFIMITFFLSIPLTSGEKDKKTRGMMRFCSVFSNNGFLGLPLAIAVFGADAKAVTVVIILNIITNILMYTLGVYLVSGDKQAMNLKKAFLNPVLIAFIVGIALNLLKVTKYVPEITAYSNYFSGIVTPISMTILGMKMGGVQFTKLFTNWKTYYVALLKLIVFPIAIVGILLGVRAIFSNQIVDEDLIMGVFMAFAVPTAGLASTFSDQFDGDTEGAVAFTLGTTMLSVLTIPVIYWLLCMI